MTMDQAVIDALRAIRPTVIDEDHFRTMKMYDLSSLFGGSLSLSVAPFSDYAFNPFYDGLTEWVKPHDTVIGIESCYPYGWARPEEDLGKGVGSLVMEEIVFRDSYDHDARLIYCETDKQGMRGLLEKYGFYAFDEDNPVLVPFYKFV